jgi:hypothetical protein
VHDPARPRRVGSVRTRVERVAGVAISGEGREEAGVVGLGVGVARGGGGGAEGRTLGSRLGHGAEERCGSGTHGRTAAAAACDVQFRRASARAASVDGWQCERGESAVDSPCVFGCGGTGGAGGAAGRAARFRRVAVRQHAGDRCSGRLNCASAVPSAGCQLPTDEQHMFAEFTFVW